MGVMGASDAEGEGRGPCDLSADSRGETNSNERQTCCKLRQRSEL